VQVNPMLVEAARVHIVNLERLFTHLETVYTPILDKNPDLRRDYTVISDNFSRFEQLDMDDQMTVILDSVQLVQRIEFLFDTFTDGEIAASASVH
jgi:hypothetical protein